MRCLTAIVNDNVDSDALVDIKPDVLVNGMSKLQQAMYAAIDFLERNIRIKNIVFVPFPIMVVPVVRFFAITLKPTADQRRALRRWFWHCAFTQRYRAGNNNSISDRAPQDYFPEIPTEIRADVFDRALIPPEDRAGTRVYAEFVKSRATALAEQASNLILNG